MSSTLPAKGLPARDSAKGSQMAKTNPPPRTARSGSIADLIFGLLAKGAALLTLALLLGILLSLFISAWPAITKYGLGFLTSTTWDPVKEEFGRLIGTWEIQIQRGNSLKSTLLKGTNPKQIFFLR